MKHLTSDGALTEDQKDEANKLGIGHMDYRQVVLKKLAEENKIRTEKNTEKITIKCNNPVIIIGHGPEWEKEAIKIKGTKMSISILPSGFFLISISFKTPVAAKVFVAEARFLATIFQLVDVISPSESILVSVLSESSSGVVANNVAVKKDSPLPNVYKAPASVVAILSSVLPMWILRLVSMMYVLAPTSRVSSEALTISVISPRLAMLCSCFHTP